MFDLRSARYFVAVAEELHFGRAAERLRMSQPPLSQAIRQLERDVGVLLFERTNRRVALTVAGEAFLVECRDLLRHAEIVVETPRLAAAGYRVQLTVGAVASAFTWPLPQALEILRTQAPHITVRIEEIDTHEAVDDLLTHRVDVALARLGSNRPGIDTQVLLEDEFVALLPPAHPLSNSNAPLELSLLTDDPWIWLPREISPDYHDDMTAVCRASGFSPRPRHWVRSIASQKALVGSGVGVTIIPRSSVSTLPSEVTARMLSQVSRAVLLSVSTRRAASSPERIFAQAVADAITADP